MDPGEIKKLETVVVNRIAAGEIIQRPANALKEMMENSLDAKATSISITVNAGGLKLLQIQDNGTGIRKEDVEIVCERFTTSKLSKFEDLTTIATYGFRGEALSSISHVAQLKIQSKTKNDKVGWQASYVDGALKPGSFKQVARNQGTQINVEDLFYNTPQRKQALRGPNEEFQKISDVVSRYAIHNPHCSFTLKKTGESSNAIRTQPKSTVVDNIRTIHGISVAKHLLKIEFNDEKLKFKVDGYITNVNFTQKKGTFLLFINHRSVQSTNIKKAIDQVYSTYLPKGEFPFIYLSLEINPLIVDVNVHPTKHEVNFLHEDSIIEKIVQQVEKILLGSNESRTFYTQARLPGAPPPLKPESKDNNKLEKTIYAKDLVRTDSKAQKLDMFLVSKVGASASTTLNKTFQSQKKDTYRKEIKLTSILTLRKEVEDDCDADLKQLLNGLTFVGTVDKTYAIIQHDTKMYLCNTSLLTEEFCYQNLLYEFENFEKIKLTNPLSIEELAKLALKSPKSGWTPEDGCIDDLAERIRDILIEKGPILEEYFALSITEDGYLTTLPVIFENYYPSMSFLPLYILRLATEIEWDVEIDCFRTICRETAKFYSKMAFAEELQWRFDIEHIIYQKMKKSMLPPKKFNTNGSILQIANLSDMYKVFERC